MEFEWDSNKEEVNLKKHGISFTAASAVFEDPRHFVEDSTKPEFGEQRHIAVGIVSGRLSAVIYTDRTEPERRRIISARKVWKNERAKYDQGAETA